jgi:Rhs element Vgr protein
MPDQRIIPAPANPDLPTYKIIVDGNAISGEIQVSAVVVTKGVNQIASARLIIYDGDPAQEKFEISDQDTFLPGKTVEIKMGYHSQEETVFKGIIVKHALRMPRESKGMLIIDCKDEAVKMTVGRKNAYYYESKDSAIIETILGNYSGVTADVEATTVTHKEMVQYYCTDWDFAVARAEVNGLVVLNSDNTFAAKKPDLSGEAALQLIYGSTIFEFEAEMDARTQYSAVKGVTWSFADQALTETDAADPGLTEAGNVSASDLSDVIGLSELKIHHNGKVEETELQAWADAAFLRSRLAKIRGRIRCQGIAAIKPGDVLELKGIGNRFNGKVYVAGVKQQLTTANWETDIEFGLSEKWLVNKYKDVMEVSASGLLPGVQGLRTGIVVALEGDPEGEDRVQVKMPLINADEDGIWARVSTLDAGDNRGSFFRPEIDDEVLLGFVNDDPRDPVILGMMNSSAKPAPLPGSNDNHEKGFVTRSEMKFIFNDDVKSITIETPGGGKFVIDEDGATITIEDKNGNIVECSDSGISMESPKDIKIKASGDLTMEGTNVNIKASAQLKAEGSAGAELSAGGTTTVKGATVMIN